MTTRRRRTHAVDDPAAPSRTYGLYLDTVTEFGTTYIYASILAREGEAPHPINCDHRYETRERGATYRAHGRRYADLQLRGFLSDVGDGDPALLGFDEPRYIDAHNVRLDVARSLVKTLSAVQREFDARRPRSPAGYLRSLYVALDLDWVVVRIPGGSGTRYADHRWEWGNVETGVGVLEALISRLPRATR